MLSMIHIYGFHICLYSCTEFTTRNAAVLSKWTGEYHAKMLGCKSNQASRNGGGGENVRSTWYKQRWWDDTWRSKFIRLLLFCTIPRSLIVESLIIIMLLCSRDEMKYTATGNLIFYGSPVSAQHLTSFPSGWGREWLWTETKGIVFILFFYLKREWRSELLLLRFFLYLVLKTGFVYAWKLLITSNQNSPHYRCLATTQSNIYFFLYFCEIYLSCISRFLWGIETNKFCFFGGTMWIRIKSICASSSILYKFICLVKSLRFYLSQTEILQGFSKKFKGGVWWIFSNWMTNINREMAQAGFYTGILF